MSAAAIIGQAMRAAREGRTADAVAGMRQAAAHDPHDHRCWHDLAALLRRAGEAAAAETAIRHALRIDATSLDYYRLLSSVLFLQGRFLQLHEPETNIRRLRNLTSLDAALAELAAAPARPAGGRNLIMGLAMGYGRAALAAFVESLADTGFAGDLVLFVDDLAADTTDWLRRRGVILEPFGCAAFLPYHIQLGRYFRYYEYLRQAEAAGRHYDKVLLTDVRDVVFQADPFALPEAGELFFTLESDSLRIGQCRHNICWTLLAFGAKVLEGARNEPVSCSGTTIGSVTGILRYLIHLQRFAVRLGDAASPVQGIDQGLHNAVRWSERVPGAVTLANHAHIATLSYVAPEALRLDEAGRVLDGAGAVVPIIHQYFAHPPLAQAVARRYADR